MKIEFTEEQRFTQWWLWIILTGVGIIPIYGIYAQIANGKAFGENPMSDLGLVGFTVFVFAFIAMFWFLRLKTEIDNNEIRMRFYPLAKKHVQWKDVKNARIVKYEFVGYGIRFGSKFGTIYNTNGNKGLAIELHNGEKFVIGTQKENELKKIVENANGQTPQ